MIHPIHLEEGSVTILDDRHGILRHQSSKFKNKTIRTPSHSIAMILGMLQIPEE